MSSKELEPSSAEPVVDRWMSAYLEMESDWSKTAQGDISFWEQKFQSMKSEMEYLRMSGEWRSGRRTLLEVLGVNTKELLMCRALEWLFQIDGWHGLGNQFAIAFFKHLGIEDFNIDLIQTSREETAGSTRADLVIRTGTATIVVEAKIYAGEANRQCDRIAEAWEIEDPTLVFLSNRGAVPETAIDSLERWKTLAWQDLGQLLKQTIAERNDQPLSAGLHELADVWSKGAS